MMSAAVSRPGHIYAGGEQKWAQHASRDRWENCGVALTPELTARHKDLYKKRGSRSLHAFLTGPTAPVAQWIEHQTTDLRVGGSTPSGRATITWAIQRPSKTSKPDWRGPARGPARPAGGSRRAAEDPPFVEPPGPGGPNQPQTPPPPRPSPAPP